MAAPVHGGDEVSALVLDIGGSTTRAGYAGDDTPKAIFPTYYGYTIAEDSTENQSDAIETDQPDQSVSRNKKVNIHIGEQTGPTTWRDHMEIANPVREGLISDFDPISAIIGHALQDTLRTNPAEHPILVTESPWNTPANRERMAEMMFEEFHVPAFYIANSAVLNAFAAGKGTALVVDIGKDTASVTPVVDGFVLRKGMTRSTVPQLVYANAMHLLARPHPHRPAIQLWPHHLIMNKVPVALNKPPSFTIREDRARTMTESWRQWAQQREVDEWIAGVAGVLEHGFSEHAANTRPPRPYEFPTGFNTLFGPDRFLPGELYFAQQQLPPGSALPQTLPQLLNTSLMSCEPDLRIQLLSNVVVNGGGSLLGGLVDRLHNELVRHFSTTKVHAAGHPTERRYGAWLGGSILASLGTFHQLWISAEEWQEHGRPIIAQRCK
ncbi:brg1-associated factor b [Ramaria rubella]|nr:brg1-associated factor b [Ramaria rubella]